jgi:ABC-type transport system involved in cytochrome c biogenesis ATPase subunit
MPEKIPATVVTGFLGAGKTSLIRHLVANAGGGAWRWSSTSSANSASTASCCSAAGSRAAPRTT